MRFDLFVEGPLLRVVFVTFSVGITVRVAFFLKAIVASSKDKDAGLKYLLLTLSRSFLPFHSGIKKRPLYASLRYVFHICLFVVPIFLFGHVVLWEESRFQWSWTPLPDDWADRMTLLVLAGCLAFLLRRIVVPEVRRSSGLSDYLFILVVSLPFLTGYLLSHGVPEFLAFLEENIWTLHVLSGELLLLSGVFLFLTTRLIEAKCTGCAACVLSCPTGTLEATDMGVNRIFRYAHYQCICCASCVGNCPEDAGELKHDVSLRRYLPKPAKHVIRSVRLEPCEECSTLFVPEPQLRGVLTAIGDHYPRLCPQCRKIGFSSVVSGLALSKRPPKLERRGTVECT